MVYGQTFYDTTQCVKCCFISLLNLILSLKKKFSVIGTSRFSVIFCEQRFCQFFLSSLDDENPKSNCTTIHRYEIFSTRYSVICKVYTGYCGTSEIEHGLCTCSIDNPLAKARGLSLRTGARTMLYLSHRVFSYGKEIIVFIIRVDLLFEGWNTCHHPSNDALGW